MQHPLLLLCLLVPLATFAQTKPQLPAGTLTGTIQVDGHLHETDWQSAPFTDALRTTEPVENGDPAFKTEVRVIASPKNIYFGITCYDEAPDQIVRFSKLRDANLGVEDHIRIVIDPALDGQSGYIFGVNANGARYDALVSRRGESENDNWDVVWDARTQITDVGWTAEIIIPIQSINFVKELDQWGFNVERRVQRLLETSRWANVTRDQWFTQTSRAGLLTDLPQFSYGLGLNVRPSLVTKLTKAGEGSPTEAGIQPSLDITQRIGANVTGSLTFNTDFAETEVDTRQTNLTRFPLFFPERRTFFLEGSDIFEFGLGTGSRTVLPFFSRRTGLFQGNEVPIQAGGKINGRLGKTAFGGMVARTGELETDELRLDPTTMGIFRVRQNVMKESSLGVIGAFGDPEGREGAFMTGLDFTYQTTKFQGDKNFLVGGWGLVAGRADLEGDRTAVGLKVDYPNDKLDVSYTFNRVGENFDPSLGFVPRKGTYYNRIGFTFAPRPDNGWLRQMFHEVFATYISELDGQWQTYGVFTAPINWRLESGDRVELNVYPRGEFLSEPFEISDGVTLAPKGYHFVRYRTEVEFAAKRKLNGQISYWFGGFYSGTLDQIELETAWNPSPLFTIEFSGQRNIGRLPEGDFIQTILGTRIRFNLDANLQINTFIQYDTESRVLGWNARLHWIFSPLGDVFLVFNQNSINNLVSRWELNNRQIILKGRYNFRW
ncbi:MAG: carbohydrate binding family 9 domain-containing protein [Bacteroidota bacterium]